MKGDQRYISRMRGDGTTVDFMMKLGTFFAPLDWINYAYFHDELFAG
jgi:hypothetical protein